MAQVSELTAFSIYTEYLTEVKGINSDRMLTSILVRYLIPALGGQTPKGKRATSDEIRSAIDYLKQVHPRLLLDAPKKVEEAFEQQGVNSKNRKTFRSILKNFVDWVANKGYSTIQEQESNEEKHEDDLIRQKSPKGQPRRNWDARNYHGKTKKETFALMAKYPSGGKQGELVYPGDYINNELASELKDFEKFRREQHNCSSGTIGKDFDQIYRILGWLHRSKEMPVENLRLTSIIPFCKLNIQIKDCLNKKGKPDLNKHYLEKAIARQSAVDMAAETKNLISQYLQFMGGHPNSSIFAVSTCIVVAKYIFRNEIDTDDYPDELEIPVIRRLLQLCKTIKTESKITPPSVSYHQKSVSWEAALQVMEKLRIQANTPIVYSKEAKYDSAAVIALQNFLSLAFMTLMPPDRPRTYYELEIGNTFVQGFYEEERFTSKEKMLDPTQAIWYIHLKPRDYKTGSTYGEYWGAVRNVYFSDGTTLYKYIDKWLTQGREYLQKCNHNFFFRGVVNYNKVKGELWHNRIVSIFDREVGIPVAPKEFRKMYVTYMKNNGATEAELEAAAWAMHHSRQMQSKT